MRAGRVLGHRPTVWAAVLATKAAAIGKPNWNSSSQKFVTGTEEFEALFLQLSRGQQASERNAPRRNKATNHSSQLTSVIASLQGGLMELDIIEFLAYQAPDDSGLFV